jgi:cytochrome c biogenesis protein CcmG/thiol:disulfide interchange protein DsbE
MTSRFRVRWIALAVGAVVVVFGVVLALNHRDEETVPRLVQEKALAPEFTLTKLDGSKLDSKDLKGKTVVVNFWNTWCIPCQREEPALKAFYDAHKNDEGLEMIGIVREDDEKTVRDYVAKHGINWTIGFDPKGSAALGFGTTGQPETYVFSPDGVAVCGTLGISNPQMLETWVDAARNGQECVT